jgi:CubicO group peptidase (beta-lactamase class C family)
MRKPQEKIPGKFAVIALLGLALALTGAATVLCADEKTDKVDKLFAEWDTPSSPGAAVAVIKDGAIVYERGYGMAKLEDGLVMIPAKVFDVASMGKQFTAACLAFLVKDGKVSVSDDIRKYIPEFPRYERTVTIDHLLHHTSGIRDGNALLDLAGFRRDSDCPTKAEALGIICRQRALNFLPGEEFSYTNSGYFLLGLIVERVSGQGLNEFAQEHIFKPLGMAHTLFQQDHNQIIKNRASGYSAGGKGFRLCMSNREQAGPGNLYTTVDDLFLWDQAFYNGKLGGITDMLHSVGTLNNGTRLDYAWGLFVGEYKGLKMVSHGGSWVGFQSQMFRFPEPKFSVICLANLNSMDPTTLCQRVADIYLAPLLKEPPKETAAPTPTVNLAPQELEALTGNYLNGKSAMWMSLSVKDNGLFMGEMGLDLVTLPVSPSRFRAMLDEATPVVLDFFPPEKGKPRKVALTVGGDAAIEFTRTLPIKALDASSLTEYAGRYSGPEILDAVYDLVMEKGNLVIKFRSASPSPLRLMAPDRFIAGNIVLDFIRDKAGRVSGVKLSKGRAVGITLHKIG